MERMKKNDKDMTERGMDATEAYLTRTGLVVVERDTKVGRTKVPFIAFEGEVLVFLDVSVKMGGSIESNVITPARRKSLSKALANYVESTSFQGESRVDVVSFLLIAEDRALLRHIRSYQEELDS